MANHRPPTGRMLPPLVTVPGPTATSGGQLQTGRSFDKTLRNIGQEQTYSRRILDNEKQQIKARYEKLKKKASQIRSNLTPEQIAELRGMEKGSSNASSSTEGGHKVELQNHSARLTSQRNQRISLELTTATSNLTASPYAKPSSALPKARPKSVRTEAAVVAPSAMGQKRVRKSATTARPDFKSKENATPKAIGAPKPDLTKQKSTEDAKRLDTSTRISWSASRPIPIPKPATSETLAKPKEVESRRDRSATVVCSPAATNRNSPSKEEPSIAEMLKRPRASSAMARLETVPAHSSPLPTVPEEVHKVYSPQITRKFSTPYPPTRPKSSICAPSSTQISSEHRLASVHQAPRFGRKLSSVTPASARPASRRKSSIVPPSPASAATARPLGSTSAEPPAAFSCHEPKLEDVLSRSYPAKNPVAIRRISTAVSPFHESRARKLEELREARLDDNELLAAELEQRKEKLMKGLQHIGGRPHYEEQEESVQAKPEQPQTSPAKLKGEKHLGFSTQQAVEIENEDPNAAWRKEMQKIRYLRLPKEYEDVITSDMLSRATAQHKAVSRLRNMDNL